MLRSFAKALIVNDAGELLVLRRSATDAERAGGWDFPGGSLEKGECFVQAATREVEEEAGIILRQPLLVYGTSTQNDWGKGVWLYYLEFVSGHPPVTLSVEHDQYKWLAPQDFLQITDYPKHHEIITFLTKHDLFANPPVTLAMATGRAVICNPQGDILMIRRSGTDETFYGGTWDLPGGQAEAGEDVSQTATREALEETGIAITDIHAVFAISRPRSEGTGTWVFFAATTTENTPTLSWEHDAYQWVPLASVAKHTDYEVLVQMAAFITPFSSK